MVYLLDLLGKCVLVLECVRVLEEVLVARSLSVLGSGDLSALPGCLGVLSGVLLLFNAGFLCSVVLV